LGRNTLRAAGLRATRWQTCATQQKTDKGKEASGYRESSRDTSEIHFVFLLEEFNGKLLKCHGDLFHYLLPHFGSAVVLDNDYTAPDNGGANELTR